MQIDIHLYNTFAYIRGMLPPEVEDELDYFLSFEVMGANYSPQYQAAGWDGRRRFFSQKLKRFPTGLLKKALGFFAEKGIDVVCSDFRVRLPVEQPLQVATPLYPYQQEILETIIPQERGIIQMATGCHHAGTEILMFDGSLKKVENIAIGELLMGPDNLPRTVLKLHRGKQDAFLITPKKGDSFAVNLDHILSLQRTCKRKRVSKKKIRSDHKGKNPVVNISVRAYLKESKTFKHTHKLYSSGALTFPSTVSLKIPPYIMGIWLGDGHSNQCCVTTADLEIETEWATYLDNLAVTIKRVPGRGCTSIFGLVKKASTQKIYHPFMRLLNEYGLHHSNGHYKHIPHDYLTSSIESRRQLLAGLLDADGYYHHNFYELVSKFKQLATDTCFLARSLGLAATMRKVLKSCQTGYIGEYYKVSISGAVDQVPVRLNKKRAHSRRQKKNIGRTGFSIAPIGEENYYGFEVDGDHLYVMGNFFVTHNSGKTLVIAHVIGRLNQNSLVLVHNGSIFEQITGVLSKNLGVPIGQIGCGKFDPQKITVGMVQTLIRSVDPKFAKTKEADWDEDDDTPTDPEIVRKLLGNVYVLCADETHRIAARTAYRVQQECKNARYRYGFSATPWRFDHADMLIEAATGAKLVDYPAKKLIAMGYLAVPSFYCVKFRHARVPSSMRYGELYTQEVVNNDERNKIACFQAAKFASQGKVVLLAVTHIKHGKLLYEMLRPALGDKLVFVSGSMKNADRMTVLRKLNTRELLVCVATTVFGEGIDIPNLDVLINLKAQDSSVDAIQLAGRALRKTDTKTKALIIDFWDYGCRFLERHFKNRLMMYEQELGVKALCVNQSNALC